MPAISHPRSVHVRFPRLDPQPFPAPPPPHPPSKIDYEGPDAESAGWTVSRGVSKISTTFANLGHFIEEFRKHVPFGAGTLTMDMYASQGGAPCLAYFANRYLPGMPAGNPSWITSGDAVGLKLKGLDWINIMVAGSDSFSSSKAFLDGYVGASAHVANQYNPVGIVKALSASRATISLIASNHCKSYDADLSQMVDYVRGEGVKGIMYVAVYCFFSVFSGPCAHHCPSPRPFKLTCEQVLGCGAFRMREFIESVARCGLELRLRRHIAWPRRG